MTQGSNVVCIAPAAAPDHDGAGRSLRPVRWRRDLSEQEAKGSQRVHRGNDREERADWGNEADGDEDNMEVKKKEKPAQSDRRKAETREKSHPATKDRRQRQGGKKQGKLE